jgi:Restriction endonuclease NaeI
LEREHQDYQTLEQIRRAILERCGGEKALAAALPTLIADAVDFVVDPVRTARTLISDLDNVEKTFIGLKIEHFLRDFLDFPKGIRDLRIGDVDVDVKTTVRQTWMIPPETFRNSEPCLLILTATEERFCSMGLILAREEYLNRPNRDGKRSVKSSAFADILWLVERQSLPESRWANIDMKRFRELRKIKGGNKRTAAFFRENLGKIVHRTIIKGLLFEHDDYMRRIRKSGGAQDILSAEDIAILSGAYRRDPIKALGLAKCGRDEFVSFAFSPDQRKLLLDAGYFDKKSQPARSKG